MKVFVYGTLKNGHGNHHWLGDNYVFLGQATTKCDDMALYDLGPFPCVSYPPEGEGGTIITGELYEVDEPTFKMVDMLEGYPDHYGRKLIRVDHCGNEHAAWIYFYATSPKNLTPIGHIWPRE